MPIQQRLSIALILIVAIFGGLSYWLLHIQVSPAFASLENQAASDDAARSRQILAAETEWLSAYTHDWSAWDDMYRFALDGNDEFVRSSLDAETIEEQQIDAAFILDSHNKVYWGMLFGEVDPALLDSLLLSEKTKATLTEHESALSVVDGLAHTKYGPFVFSSQPIVRTNDQGPIAGTFIFGFLLGDERLQRYRQRTEVEFDLLPASGNDQVADAVAALDVAQDQYRYNYSPLHDLNGDPFLVMRTKTAKTITALGDRTLSGSLMLLSFVTLLVSLIGWFLLRLAVVKPLTALTQHVARLTSEGDMTERPDPVGEGEFVILSESIFMLQETILERENQLRVNVDTLEYQATHDALTGLANRRMLYDQLEELIAQTNGAKRNCVCIIDLDGFKAVNDTSGHAAGDALLVQIATLISDAIYSTDTIARLGGDEFAILFRNCDRSSARRRCEDVRQRVESHRFVWCEKTHRIAASIGLVEIPDSETSVSAVLQKADNACFDAKDNGRNQVCTGSMRAQVIPHAPPRQNWEKRIRTALEENHFLLFLQELVPLQSDHQKPINGVEVLVRLRDYSERKFIPPGAFLPSAERQGLTQRLDRWVVSQLLRSSTVYEEVLGDDRMYWINLSCRSLADNEFVRFLESALEATDLPPGRINFELSDSTAIADVRQLSRVIERLQKHGCQFALDDFGSGFASFEYLRELPIDYVKIDGQLISKVLRSKLDRALVKSIADIAKTLDIDTVAVSVDDPDMIAMLKSLGVNYGQGSCLSQPRELGPCTTPTRQAQGN